MECKESKQTPLNVNLFLDTKPHPIVHDEKISLKKVLDMVNKSDDQGLKDMNKKLQNMLEETLTKNMHLQKVRATLKIFLFPLSRHCCMGPSVGNLFFLTKNLKLDTH